MKPFPSSSVGLAGIKHSFRAQSNPPFHASASPNPLLGEAVALQRFRALHPTLSSAAPAHTSISTFPERMPAGPWPRLCTSLSGLCPPPAFWGTTEVFLRRQWSSHGAHGWLCDDKRLFVGRRGCKIFHLPPSTSALGDCFAQEVRAFTSRLLLPGCTPQCANLFSSWLFPGVGAPQTPLEPRKDSEPPSHFSVCPSASVR